ncbi:MAG: DUF1045 domain-containing protein [Burkholderiaceae bacterium]|nr:DUF1045 domain-containing protein [Aquabacterium sp.]NUP86705.1 DUF1045 domain-containing protein [Burkholderiaceae bacterium]
MRASAPPSALREPPISTRLSHAGAVATARLAVYWVPAPDHPLWVAGCQWLGRDPHVGDAPEQRPPAYARDPWRYGFHATLKAPMALRPGCSEERFLSAVAALAARHRDFALPPLQANWLAGFLALRPSSAPAPGHPLRRLADACVTELDDCRAPMDLTEIERRGSALPPAHHDEQLALLRRWGYPHVLGHWRFHLTLSDRDPADAPALLARARTHFARALEQPLRAHAIAVWREDAPGAPLRLLERFRLATC